MKYITAFILTLLLTTSAMAMETEPFAIAKAIGCTACHEINRKVVGPAWMDVSNRYADKDIEETKAILRDKITNGGKGNWSAVTGGMFMPQYGSRIDSLVKAHRIPENSVDVLIDFILNLHNTK